MLITAVAIYTLYILIKIYVSVMQIGYVNRVKKGSAVLMSKSEFIKAGNYAVAKEKLSIASSFFEYIVLIAWLGGAIAYLDSAFLIANEGLKTVVIVISFVIIGSIISLPFDIYEKFVLDAKFGFNKSTVGLYVKDTVITTIISIVIGSAVIYGVYLIITSTTLWWLWSFLFIFAIIIAINMLFPTVRAMFFDKLSPLEDEELNEQIQTLMDKTGFVSSGVFVSDASKRDARLNAYFGGLGKTKRVVLFDTLIEKLTSQELLAVLGHELGHYAHGDIYKNIALMGGMLFGMFAIFGNLPSELFLELKVSVTPANLMILFLLFMPLLGFIMMPIFGLVSRHNEFEADKTGAELGGGFFLIQALTKLVSENKSFPLSHPLYIFFHYTHPPVLERIKELGGSIENIGSDELKEELKF
ncbi:MAG: M48 family metallopeptidase [Campylobacterota bacterium]|nr:M48 family metallopeptidase [Campylobacterota bacterium]